jgi:hypothetical protein
VAVTLVRSIFSTRSTLTDIESIEKLFQIILPVVREREGGDGTSTSAAAGGEEEGGTRDQSFEEEQVGREDIAARGFLWPCYSPHLSSVSSSWPALCT